MCFAYVCKSVGMLLLCVHRCACIFFFFFLWEYSFVRLHQGVSKAPTHKHKNTHTHTHAGREAEVSFPRGDNMPRWVSVRKRAGVCFEGVCRDLPLAAQHRTAQQTAAAAAAAAQAWPSTESGSAQNTHMHTLGYTHIHTELRRMQPQCHTVGVFERKREDEHAEWERLDEGLCMWERA